MKSQNLPEQFHLPLPKGDHEAPLQKETSSFRKNISEFLDISRSPLLQKVKNSQEQMDSSIAELVLTNKEALNEIKTALLLPKDKIASFLNKSTILKQLSKAVGIPVLLLSLSTLQGCAQQNPVTPEVNQAHIAANRKMSAEALQAIADLQSNTATTTQLQGVVDALSEQIKKLNTELGRTAEDHNTSKISLQELLWKVNEFKENYDRYTKNMDAIIDKILNGSASKEEVEELRTMLKDAENSVSELETTQNNLSSTQGQMKLDLSYATETAEDASNRVGSLEERIPGLIDEIQNLADFNNKQMKEVQESISVLLTATKWSQEDVNYILGQLYYLSEDLQDMRNRFYELPNFSNVSDLQVQINDLYGLVFGLINDYDTLRNNQEMDEEERNRRYGIIFSNLENLSYHIGLLFTEVDSIKAKLPEESL